MAHFARVVDGIVVEVIVAEQVFVDGLDGTWIQTSYNTRLGSHTQNGTPLRGNFAGRGYIYDSANDVFYPPSPHESWTINTTTWTWEPPVAPPSDMSIDNPYDWNEENQTWDAVTLET